MAKALKNARQMRNAAKNFATNVTSINRHIRDVSANKPVAGSTTKLFGIKPAHSENLPALRKYDDIINPPESKEQDEEFDTGVVSRIQTLQRNVSDLEGVLKYLSSELTRLNKDKDRKEKERLDGESSGRIKRTNTLSKK